MARSKVASFSVAEHLLASWPPILDELREALRASIADADCEAWGARTRAARVDRDATSWAKTIDRALRAHPFALRRYSPLRFVFFLECIVALERAIATQRAPGSKGGSKKAEQAELTRLSARALAARDDLLVALSVVISPDVEAQARLSTIARDDDPKAVVAALRALADLADEHGRTYDRKVRALVASVGLRAEDAEAARHAATSLELALRRHASDEVESAVDLAETNRIEGRVLAEMSFAAAMFAHARVTHSRVPVLGRKVGTGEKVTKKATKPSRPKRKATLATRRKT